MNIQEIIKKSREAKIPSPFNFDMKELVAQAVQNIINQNIGSIKERLESEVLKLAKEKIDSLPTLKGQDSRAEDVASILIFNKNFLNKVKGDKGDAPTIGEIIKVLKNDSKFINSLRGDKGDSLEAEAVAALLIKDRGFISKLKGRDGSSDTALEIVNKLNTLEEVIDQKTIIGLRKTINFLERSIQRKIAKAMHGGGSGTGTGGGHVIKEEGSALTQRTNLNFVGAGVTVTDDAGNDATKVTITGGSGTFGIIAVSGTIDDSNNVFTSVTEPTVLVINGGVYQTTGGSVTWTWVVGTITLLDQAGNAFAVGTGGSIFGL